MVLPDVNAFQLQGHAKATQVHCVFLNVCFTKHNWRLLSVFKRSMPTEIYNKWCSLLLQYRLAGLFLRSPLSQKASSTERPSHEGLALQFDVLKVAQRTCSRQTCICVIESTFQTCTQVSVILVFKQAMHALSIHVIRFHLSDACAANLLTCTKGTQH
jgi:hypothetical protein